MLGIAATLLVRGFASGSYLTALSFGPQNGKATFCCRRGIAVAASTPVACWLMDTPGCRNRFWADREELVPTLRRVVPRRLPERDRRRHSVIILACLAILTMAVLGPGSVPAQAQEADEELQQELADRFAPIVKVKAQEEPCDETGEQYAPTSVDIVLDNPLVVLRQVGPQDPVLMQGPGTTDIFGLGETAFLDFPGPALNPGCLYEKDFLTFSEGQPAVVYAHIVKQDDHPDMLALQYWFFWYYNDWNNKHEGDWEGIQLLFDVGSVPEALSSDPVSVGYAQHEGGERSEWNDEKLEREGSRPVVYPSAGSHASYYSQALYLGRSGSEGFGCDNTDGPSDRLDPEVVVLPDAVDDPDSPLAWLAFEGRWGERQSGPFNGPTGPANKGRWTDPVDWHDELRSRSVVVPAGDGSGAEGLILAFCSVVEVGSEQLITLKQNPAVLLIGIIVLAGAISFLLGRTDWTPVQPLPILARRRAGQLIRAAGVLFRNHPTQWLSIGLIFFPVAVVIGVLMRLARVIPFIDTALEAEADVGAVGAVLAVVIGAAGNLFGGTVVAAGVAFRMREIEDGQEPSIGRVYRAIGERLGDLLGLCLRVMVVVTVLLVSIVGIPWGIRRALGYVFVAPASMLEGKRGREALNRSSDLVVGRVLHTAGVVVLLYSLVALVAAIVGLLLLVLLTGIPLWLFSVLIAGSSVITVPFVGIALTLLYGNARAELEHADRAELLDLTAV